MSNKNQVVGEMTVTFAGITFSTAGETTLELGGKKREPVKGDYEAGSFITTTEPSKCEVTLLHKPGVDLEGIQEIDDATLVLQADNGVSYIVRNAYSSEPPSFGQDGKAKITLQGPPARRMV